MNNQIIENEMCVLGTIINNNDYFLKTVGVINAEDFYIDKHRMLFKAIESLFKSDKEFDSIILSIYLEKPIQDGKITITDISNISSYGEKSTFKTHLNILAENGRKRKLKKLCQEILNSDISSKDIISKMENGISSNSNFVKDKNRIMSIKEVMENQLLEIEKAYNSKDGFTGISTGIFLLDNRMNGFERKELNIIAARPSCGKTAFSIKILNGLEGNVLYIQSDMKVGAMANRMMSLDTKIENGKISRGKMNDNEWIDLGVSAGRYSMKENINFIETGGITIQEIRQKVKELKVKDKIDVLMIDHIGKIVPENGGSGYEQISKISSELKRIAIEFDINVTALCQLSRKVEERNDKRPFLSDLRDSGRIEEDADNILLLYRDGYYNGLTESQIDILECNIAKCRNGRVGIIEFEYNLKTQEIAEILD